MWNYTPKAKARQTVTCCKLHQTISKNTPISIARQTVTCCKLRKTISSTHSNAKPTNGDGLQTAPNYVELHTQTQSQTNGDVLQTTSNYVDLHTQTQSQTSADVLQTTSQAVSIHTPTRKARQRVTCCKVRQTISHRTTHPHAKADKW